MTSTDCGYLIHSRKYTDTRIILNLFTEQYGLISCVHRVSRSKKKVSVTPQPFTKFALSWKGGGGLKTMLMLEQLNESVSLVSQALYCGLYANEIIQRSVAENDSSADLFNAYETLIRVLPTCENELSLMEVALRNFELVLVRELGYAVDFEADTLGDEIKPDTEKFYLLSLQEGFQPVLPVNRTPYLFNGREIHAIGQRDFRSEDVRQAAKRMCRLLLKPLIGEQPLKSRELFSRK